MSFLGANRLDDEVERYLRARWPLAVALYIHKVSIDETEPDGSTSLLVTADDG